MTNPVTKSKIWELPAQPFRIKVLVDGVQRKLERNDQGELLFSDTLLPLGNAVTFGGTIDSPILSLNYPKIIVNLTDSHDDRVIKDYIDLKDDPDKTTSTLLRIYRVLGRAVRDAVPSNDPRLIRLIEGELQIKDNFVFLDVVNSVRTTFTEVGLAAAFQTARDRFNGEKTLEDAFNEFLDQFPDWKPSPYDDEVSAYEKNRNYLNYRILEPLRPIRDGLNTWYAPSIDGGYVVQIWVSNGDIVPMVGPAYSNRKALLLPLSSYHAVNNTPQSLDNGVYPKLLVNLRTNQYKVILSRAYAFPADAVSLPEGYFVMQVLKPQVPIVPNDWVPFEQGVNNLYTVDLTGTVELTIRVDYIGTTINVRPVPYSTITLAPPPIPLTTTAAPTTTVTTTVAPTTTVA